MSFENDINKKISSLTRKYYSRLIIFTTILCSLFQSQSLDAQILPMKGITLVAPPSPIGQSEIDALIDVNTEWIALVPYGFSRDIDNPIIRYNLERQWWGEKKEGVESCIKLAHQNNIKVMLKPQVYIHAGTWAG